MKFVIFGVLLSATSALAVQGGADTGGHCLNLEEFAKSKKDLPWQNATTDISFPENPPIVTKEFKKSVFHNTDIVFDGTGEWGKQSDCKSLTDHGGHRFNITAYTKTSLVIQFPGSDEFKATIQRTGENSLESDWQMPYGTSVTCPDKKTVKREDHVVRFHSVTRVGDETRKPTLPVTYRFLKTQDEATRYMSDEERQAYCDSK